MAPDCLSTKAAFVEGSSPQDFLVLGLKDGRFYEWYRETDVWLKDRYEAPISNGSTTIRLLEATERGRKCWCALGGYVLSWVGDSGAKTHGRLFTERVAQEEYCGVVAWGSETASIVIWDSQDADRMIQVFYISNAGFLVGFDSFAAQDGGGIVLERQRRYSAHGTRQPSGDWMFKAPEFKVP